MFPKGLAVIVPSVRPSVQDLKLCLLRDMLLHLFSPQSVVLLFYVKQNLSGLHVPSWV